MKILVIGATGLTGRLLVTRCLNEGFEVSVFVRTKEQFIDDKRVNIIYGDILDKTSTEDAIKGQDKVLCALGVKQGQKPGKTRSKGTENIINAMEKHNVRRLVLISTIGVNDSINRMSLFSKIFLPFIIGKARLKEAEQQENLVTKSHLDWTIIRPPRLVQQTSSEYLSLILQPSKTKFTDFISRKLLAEFMVDKLNDDRSYLSKITVVGS